MKIYFGLPTFIFVSVDNTKMIHQLLIGFSEQHALSIESNIFFFLENAEDPTAHLSIHSWRNNEKVHSFFKKAVQL